MRLDKFKEKTVGKILDHVIDQKEPDRYTASNNITVSDASKKMKNKYGLLAVLGPDGKIIQVVSKSDITFILSNQITLEPDNELLKTIQTRIKYTPLSTESSVEDILDFVIEKEVEDVVIADKEGKYYGIISKDNLREAIDEIVD